MKKVIFACVHNAGRSQMAAAFFNHLNTDAGLSAISAGTAPMERVHPEVVSAMAEVGIDLRAAIPTRLTDEMAEGAHTLVTMGCGEACPLVLGPRRLDWPLTNPKGQTIEAVRSIRKEIEERVRALLASLSETV